jgi:hypothetical protein
MRANVPLFNQPNLRPREQLISRQGSVFKQFHQSFQRSFSSGHEQQGQRQIGIKGRIKWTASGRFHGLLNIRDTDGFQAGRRSGIRTVRYSVLALEGGQSSQITPSQRIAGSHSLGMKPDLRGGSIKQYDD